jgi:hypothetical protein
LTIDVSGVATGTSPLQALALNPTSDLLITDMTLTDPTVVSGSDQIAGNFFLTNFAKTGEEKGAITFTATLVSDGPWTAS